MAREDDKNRALIIVDVQPTFTEGGALGVEGGNAVAERIADFVTGYADEYEFICTTQDWHINPGSHFSDHPDFVDSWPRHGVAGTAEAELHEAIASLPLDESVKKGQYSDGYSGFDGVNEQGEDLEQILRAHNIQALDVVGIAESHCVKATAVDGVKKGWPVRVFSDLTVPVSEELGKEARQEMDEAGVDQLPSSEAFGFYEEPVDQPIPGDTYDNSGSYDDDDIYDSDSYDNGSYDSDAYSDTDYPDSYEEDIDFSFDADDADFDFSDIDINKELGN